jgi:serine/threonine protein kinase
MMLSGEQPFYDENVPKLVEKITNDPIVFNSGMKTDVSSEALELIEKMLVKDPS